MLRTLHLGNFRSHGGEQSVEFAPLTLVVGPNGAGKTALLDALDVMRATAADSQKSGLSLPVALEPLAHGGALWFRSDRTQPLALGLTVGGHDATDEFTYQCSIRPRRPDVGLHDLYDGQWRHRLILALGGELTARSWREDTDEQPLVEVDGRAMDGLSPVDQPFERRLVESMRQHLAAARDPELQRAVDPFRSGMASVQDWLTERLTVLRVPRGAALFDPTIGSAPLTVGEYGAATMQRLSMLHSSAEHDERTEALDGWLNRLGVEKLKAGWANGQRLRVTYRDPGTQTALPLQAAGGGIQQLLAALTELAGALQPRTLVIDEAEHGLHPEHIVVLASILCEAVTDWGHQVVVITQSPTLVLGVCQAVAQRRIASDQVAVVAVERNSSGSSTMKRIGVDGSGWLEGGWLDHYARVERDLMGTFLNSAADDIPATESFGD